MTVTLLDKSLYDVLADLGYDMQFYGVRDLANTADAASYGIRAA